MLVDGRGGEMKFGSYDRSSLASSSLFLQNNDEGIPCCAVLLHPSSTRIGQGSSNPQVNCQSEAMARFHEEKLPLALLFVEESDTTTERLVDTIAPEFEGDVNFCVIHL